MIISYSKNFIYIHIDKAGGTSIEESLTPFLDFKDILFGGVTLGKDLEDAYLKYYGPEYHSMGIHKHSTAKQIKSYVGEFWNSSYKFATVRDPIDICISLYFYNLDILNQYVSLTKNNTINELLEDNFILNKIIENGDDYLITLAKQIQNKQRLDDFIIYLIDINHSATMPQIEKLDNDLSVNIFDISNINDSWSKILSNINISKQFELPVYNSSSNPGNIDLLDNTVKTIKNRFEKDYQVIPKITGVSWK